MENENQFLLFNEEETVQLTEHLSIASIHIDKLKLHSKNNKILPKLTKSEKQRLKERIQQYGFNEPIEITKNKVILDGNHRVEILRKYKEELNIEKVPYKVIDIDESDEVKYIVEKNSDRRQLSPLVLSYLRGKQYNEIKQDPTKNLKKGNNIPSDQNDHSAKSSESIANKFGVSPPTIRRDGEFSNNIDLICSYYNIEEPFDLLIYDIDKNIPKLTKDLTKTIGKALREFEKLIEGKEHWISKLFNTNKKAIEIIDDFMRGKDKVFKHIKKILNRVNDIYPNLYEDVKTYIYDVSADKIEENTYNFKEYVLNNIENLSIDSLNNVYNEILNLKTNTYKKAQSEQEYYRNAENEKELDEMKKQKELQFLKDRIQIRHGDFNELSEDIEDNSIDAIITDPPYPKEFLDCWRLLSQVAKRVLKPGGFLITYAGKYYLPEVISYLSNHLEYYWQFILMHTGPLAAVHPVKINTGYKPILVYYKPFDNDHLNPPKIDNYIKDVIDGSGREKSHHEWEQSVDEMKILLDNFTKENDIILDPFGGSGSTGALCKENNRRCILIEKEEEHYNTMLERIYNV